METITLNVPGISCDGWVVTIRMAVGRLEGLGKITGEAKSRTLTVEYEPTMVTIDAIQGALKQVGYESTQLQWCSERLLPRPELGPSRGWEPAFG